MSLSLRICSSLAVSLLIGCKTAPSEPPQARVLSAELASGGTTLRVEFDRAVSANAAAASAFRLSRIAHSDESSTTTTWYTDISLVTCIAGRLRGLNGPCDPRTIPPVELGLNTLSAEPSAALTLTLDPPASSDVLDIACRNQGTLDAFCASNPRYTECAEFIALHHAAGDSPTLSDVSLPDVSPRWVRGLQTRADWFMELVTPGEGPDDAAIRVTCAN